MKKAFLFLADGVEECEALITVDILRRAGVDVTTVSINGSKQIKSSHNIIFMADSVFEDTDFADGNMFILPGGGVGTQNLKAHEGLKKLIFDSDLRKKYIAAICAAPSFLGSINLLLEKKATCYPGFEKELKGAIYRKDKVVVDGNIITSRGLGTAVDFGLKLAEILMGKDVSKKIAEGIIYA